jgi:3-deoxy-manno-octulosonate cytidylyltransferase (CMP-KDO synthetase)
VELGSVGKRGTDPEVLVKPNAMKVVLNNQHEALYFSRNCIPYLRDYPASEWLNHHIFYKHIGIYAYRKDILENIVKLPKGKLEKAESLEQLRWLENGYTIKVAETEIENMGIDTPEDLDRALKELDGT